MTAANHVARAAADVRWPARVGRVGGSHGSGGNVAYTDVENLEWLVSVSKHGVVSWRDGCGLSV